MKRVLKNLVIVFMLINAPIYGMNAAMKSTLVVASGINGGLLMSQAATYDEVDLKAVGLEIGGIALLFAGYNLADGPEDGLLMSVGALATSIGFFAGYAQGLSEGRSN